MKFIHGLILSAAVGFLFFLGCGKKPEPASEPAAESVDSIESSVDSTYSPEADSIALPPPQSLPSESAPPIEGIDDTDDKDSIDIN